jgi:hypothetical protein
MIEMISVRKIFVLGLLLLLAIVPAVLAFLDGDEGEVYSGKVATLKIPINESSAIADIDCERSDGIMSFILNLFNNKNCS